MKKSYWNLIAWFLVLLSLFVLSFASVQALGVSPPSELILFEPGLVKEGTVNIVARGDSFGAKLSIDGDLKEYITLREDYVDVPPQGRAIAYTLRLPQAVRPGSYKAVIYIEKGALRGAGGAGRAPFGAVAAVGYNIYIVVPQRERYIEVGVENPKDVNVGEPITFHIQVANYGNESLSGIYGMVHVVNASNVTVFSVATDAADLKTGDKQDLYAYWIPRNVNPGYYRLRVEVAYGTPQPFVAESQPFRIGDIFVDATELSPRTYTTGTINKFDVTVKSFWSTPLPNVYATVDVLNGTQRIDTLSTAPILLDSWQEDKLEAFWQARNDSQYTMRVTVNYHTNKTTTREFEIRQLMPVASGGEARTSLVFLIVLAVSVIIFLAGVLIYGLPKLRSWLR